MMSCSFSFYGVKFKLNEDDIYDFVGSNSGDYIVSTEGNKKNKIKLKS